MSDTSDRLIKFEEDNFIDLAEKFIKLPLIEEKWIDFVYQEYEDSIQDPPDYDDEYHGEEKGYA